MVVLCSTSYNLLAHLTDAPHWHVSFQAFEVFPLHWWRFFQQTMQREAIGFPGLQGIEAGVLHFGYRRIEMYD